MKSEAKGITAYGFFAALAIVLIPFNAINIAGRGILIYVCIPLLLFGIVRLLSHREQLSVTLLQLSLLLFFAYYLVASLWSPKRGMDTAYNFIKVFIFTVCIAFGDYTAKEKKLLMFASFITGLLVCAMLLWGAAAAVENSQRVTISVFGTNRDPNYLCFSLLFPALICVRGLLSKRALLVKIFFAAILLVLIYCTISTGSRGGVVALAAVIVVYFLYWGRMRRGRKILMILVALLLVYIAQQMMSSMPEEIINRFTYEKVAKTGGGGRMEIWMRVFRLIFASPVRFLIGYGSGASVILAGIATHNHLLQIWLENGIVGLALYGAFLINLLRYLLRRKNGTTIAVFFAAILQSLTLSVQTIPSFWSVIALCIALGDYQPFFKTEAAKPQQIEDAGKEQPQ